MRSQWNTAQSKVNLVSARSRSHSDAGALSRNRSADGYAQLRQRRAFKRKALVGVLVTLASLLVAALVAFAMYTIFINNKLETDIQGNKADFNSGIYEGIFTQPTDPEAPFWILLMGTDNRNPDEIARTDTLILARVDQRNKTAAMVSIPRDLYIEIPGYGYNKINAAYAFAEADKPGSGPAQAIKAVQAFAHVDIAYFAQVDFNGLVQLVDGLGGVEVDVPVDILDDPESGGLDIYTGLQTLDGAHALTFCRARNPFGSGDYQRQANQRTFLQALVKQVLSSDLPTIATTVTNVADMTFTNMDLATLIKVAQGMQGMQESNIHTYFVPSEPDLIDEVSYVVADTYAWQELISALNAGEYPEHQDDPYAGVIPDGYLPNAAGTVADQLAGQVTNIVTGDYVVDVRNGYGTQGSATSISDMLVLAGYRRGDIGNANSFVYETTLVIYKDAEDRATAEDIRKRLGYGKVIASLGQYTFNGDILVVVGGEFER
jgi:LCP family protein required for cell wall assembly